MVASTLGNNGAKARVEDEIFGRGRDLRGSGFRTLLLSCLGVSLLVLVVLMVQVVSDGWSVLSTRPIDFLTGVLRSQPGDDALGISQGLVGSFWIAVFVTFLAFPVGIAAAVYLEEYAKQNRVTTIIDTAVRNLAGVPSVVYGLLGLFLLVKGSKYTNWLFVHPFNWFWKLFKDEAAFQGQSTLIAGGMTLAILVLPIVIITAAEAIRAVPSSLRQGAYGVGATKWDVIRTQVLPYAAPGILTGTLLSLSRAIGEAAPLILVGAITGRLAPRESVLSGIGSFTEQFADKFTAMPIVIVGWIRQPGETFQPAAGAAIVVLLILVIAMNSVAVALRNYFEKKRG